MTKGFDIETAFLIPFNLEHPPGLVCLLVVWRLTAGTGKDLPKTELQPVDDLAILACNILVSLHHVTGSPRPSPQFRQPNLPHCLATFPITYIYQPILSFYLCSTLLLTNFAHIRRSELLAALRRARSFRLG